MPKPIFNHELAFKSIVGSADGRYQNPVPRLAGEEKSRQPDDARLTAIGKAELKSRRASLLIRPSVYEAASRKCRAMGISINDCVNQLLEQWSQAAE